jgi:hypothetical protein
MRAKMRLKNVKLDGINPPIRGSIVDKTSKWIDGLKVSIPL